MKFRGPDGSKTKLADGANLAGYEIDKRICDKVFRNVNFENAKFSGSAFQESGLSFSAGGFVGCNFRNSEISIFAGFQSRFIDFGGSCFDGAVLSNMDFWWCDFRETSFVGADLRTSKFTHCNFSYADFSDARANEANFKYMYDDPGFNVFGRSIEAGEAVRGPQREVSYGVFFPLG